jgi:hypothetical protein
MLPQAATFTGRGAIGRAVIAWESTENLILDEEGGLWRIIRDPDEGPNRERPLGPIEDVAGDDLGDDLAGELAELLGVWRGRFNPRDPVETAWRLAKGC